jgi:capsular exopolysaccharide synthesis family protein
MWIESQEGRQQGDVNPIRQSGLLEANAWIELLLSYTVLDSIVVGERLYITPPQELEDAFTSLAIDTAFVPGRYELEVDEDGVGYAVRTQQGQTIEQGSLGGPIGAAIGLRWAPAAGSLPAGRTVEFRVTTPREAAQDLRDRLRAGMDQTGRFLNVQLDGTQPERLARIVNALMERHVEVAADLKRSRLEEYSAILEEQLQRTEQALADAERELEVFRISTISLPTDESQPIAPGLQSTRGPVFQNFFTMRIELDEVRRDRQRLQTVLSDIRSSGEVRIEALEMVPSANRSSELRSIVDELVNVRAEVRVFRDTYQDSYRPLQDLLGHQATLETEAIPSVLQGILDQLAIQDRDLQTRIDNASTELEAIPPRMIDEGRLERTVTITTTLYNELRSRVETARLAAASSIPDVRILDRAAVPQTPTTDDRVRWAGMIFLGFIGAAIGGALLLDRTDARFRYASDIGRDIGLDILGSIPKIQAGSGRRGVLNAAQALEAFRELRIHTSFAYGSAGPITVTISSPSAGEGKSLISSNLAVAFAEVSRRTVLIDGDTRRGDAHRLLGLEQSPGLVDYLKGRAGQEVIQKTEHANLDFIGCGSRGATTPELLASSRMAEFIGTLKRSYEVIIIDSPPLAAGGDALILSTLTGNLAVVIRTGATDKQLAQAKLDQLTRLPIRVLGAILNDVDPSDGYHYYYSAYLPGYEPFPEEGEEETIHLLAESDA